MDQLLESILLTVGTEAAKKIYEIHLRDHLRRGTLADALSRRGFNILDCRRAKRQFDRIAESIADTLEPFLEVEAPSIQPSEVTAALLGVRDSFEAAELDVDRLLSVDLDPVHLEQQIRASSRPVVQGAGLSPDGTYVYNFVLRELCNYIIEITTTLPSLNGFAFRELLTRETAILDLVREVMARMPSASSGRSGDEDLEFELRYRRSIVRRLDHLELFGLTLSESSRRYALGVAYISLAASHPACAPNEGSLGVYQTVLDNRERRTEIDVSQKRDDGLIVDAERIEDLFFAFPKLMIKGEAGSGKTTLLQWLTVNIARQSLPVGGMELRDSIPFFLQLRRYANSTLPRPEEFLRHTVPSIEGVMPRGWIHRQLIHGRAIVMVDGLDEFPETRRGDVISWLEDLMSSYSGCRFIVTSRPSAVTVLWFNRLDFLSAELQPMTVDDIRSFIDHWHDAAIATTAVVETKDMLARYAVQLKETVLSSPQIRALATSPLLCAMLCALNRDRRTRLPRDRMELYRIALEMLLDRRDIERHVETDIPELSLREKEVLLQHLAHWLMLNNQSDTTLESAMGSFQLKLSSMPHVRSSAREVFQLLLTRSGLLRQPVPGRVDFIHRTFQEYLTGREAIDQGNIPMLISRAHEDNWREATILACGHASPAQRRQLICGLLDRADDDSTLRHVLHLVAVACLETSVELDHDIVERINVSLTGLVPPTFDPGRYARDVLGRSMLSNGQLTITHPDLLEPSKKLPNLRELCCDFRNRIGSLDSLMDRTEITSLILINNSRVGCLEPLRTLPNLRYLDLEGCTRIESFEPLSALERLHWLDLSYTRIATLGMLPDTEELKSLSLNQCEGLKSLSGLEQQRGLVNLNIISRAETDFECISELPKVESLMIGDCRTQTLDFLPAPLSLRSLFLSRMKLCHAGRLSELESLREINISSVKAPDLDESLANLRGLIRMYISDVDSIFDTHFTAPLLYVDLNHASNLTLDFLPPTVESLSVYGCHRLRDISKVAEMSKLRYLDIRHCGGILDISALESLTNAYIRLDATLSDRLPKSVKSRNRVVV